MSKGHKPKKKHPWGYNQDFVSKEKKAKRITRRNEEKDSDKA